MKARDLILAAVAALALSERDLARGGRKAAGFRDRDEDSHLVERKRINQDELPPSITRTDGY